MTSTTPAVYGQFGQTLAFAERTLSASLREHLDHRGIEPETWYALQLVVTRGPELDHGELTRLLEGSPNLDPDSTLALLAQLRTDGLIEGEAVIDLTPAGETLHADLREYILGLASDVLGASDLEDLETTVRTLQAITQRAEAGLAARAA